MLLDQGLKIQSLTEKMKSDRKLNGAISRSPESKDRLIWLRKPIVNNNAAGPHRRTRTQSKYSSTNSNHRRIFGNNNLERKNGTHVQRKLTFDNDSKDSLDSILQKRHHIHQKKENCHNISRNETEIRFPRLDPEKKEHARRIHQRQRMVSYGKNTVGYDEYIKKIPKHKRKPRSLEHPMTPDAGADIPNKRWLGLVKAWRKGLHKYDPPGMAVTTQKIMSLSSFHGKVDETKFTIQEKQIQEATLQGLPVQFASTLQLENEAEELNSMLVTNSMMESSSTSSFESSKIVSEESNTRFDNEGYVGSCRWADLCESSDDELL